MHGNRIAALRLHLVKIASPAQTGAQGDAAGLVRRDAQGHHLIDGADKQGALEADPRRRKADDRLGAVEIECAHIVSHRTGIEAEVDLQLAQILVWPLALRHTG